MVPANSNQDHRPWITKRTKTQCCLHSTKCQHTCYLIHASQNPWRWRSQKFNPWLEEEETEAPEVKRSRSPCWEGTGIRDFKCKLPSSVHYATLPCNFQLHETNVRATPSRLRVPKMQANTPIRSLLESAPIK